MKKEQAIKFLSRSKQELSSRLALFGSTVRDTAGSDSDVDTLVDFDWPATSRRYLSVQFFLEDLMGCSTDLVTEKARRPELRPYVEREHIYV